MDTTTETDDDPRATRFGVDGTGIAIDTLAEEDTSSTPGRIVVGIDGSDQSLDALRRALRIRGDSDAPVELVAAWQYPNFYGAMTSPDWSPERDAEELLADATKAVFDETAPAWLTRTTRRGNPAEVLIQESQGADMLILGSRGHGGFAGLLLGSVSMACAEHAHCPVLIMHEPAAPHSD
ncbi:MAG: universal stress protein [Herbiconiux sp.]|uniref:universal stress protein n=1 Tax=Herbiconiux sp. TaxID=1871186 RepID=UPI0012190F1A|nr:universal stress protein [Herbiconiux sp.]TAJ48177.1 MAG: universal stress protein [Herbiconiux sp.]